MLASYRPLFTGAFAREPPTCLSNAAQLPGPRKRRRTRRSSRPAAQRHGVNDGPIFQITSANATRPRLNPTAVPNMSKAADFPTARVASNPARSRLLFHVLIEQRHRRWSDGRKCEKQSAEFRAVAFRDQAGHDRHRSAEGEAYGVFAPGRMLSGQRISALTTSAHRSSTDHNPRATPTQTTSESDVTSKVLCRARNRITATSHA